VKLRLYCLLLDKTSDALITLVAAK